MDVEPIPLRKRKVLAKEDPFENGKRVKFESFPKATSKLAVSAVALSVPAEENTLECKKIICTYLRTEVRGEFNIHGTKFF